MSKRQEIFSIPNIMGYIRILLIPVFMYLYITAESPRQYFAAAIVVLISTFSDMFDGLVARKFDMITELGKFIDPLADKLTHCALMICLLTHYSLAWLLLAIFVVKEGFMAIAGLVMIRHNGKKLDGAMWFGKVCTAILFLSMFALFLMPQMPENIVKWIIFSCSGIMIVTLCLYIPVFAEMYREP